MKIGDSMVNVLKKFLNNKLVNNFIVLISGDAFVSGLNILSTAIIINAIGLSQNGMILMIQSYSLFFDQTFNFKSFQALIKYLSLSISKGDDNKTKSYIKQSLFLDFITALIATIVGIVCLDLVIKLMGWDYKIKIYLAIYLITIIFNLSGTCIGVLRIFNKFNYITYINMISAIVRIILFIIGFISKQGFIYFLIIEIIYSIIKNILYIIYSYKTLCTNKLGDFYRVKLKISKSFFMFNLYSNLTSTIDLPIGTLTTFIINKYLGFELISVYKIFEKIGSLLGRLAEPLNQIVYPELNNLISNNNKQAANSLVKKLILGISAVGVIGISFILFTYKLWLWLLIPNYEVYIGSLMLYILFIIFVNVTASVHSLFLASGYVKYTLPIVLIINIIYCLFIIPIIKTFMLNGVILVLFIQAIMVVIAKLCVMKFIKNIN